MKVAVQGLSGYLGQVCAAGSKRRQKIIYTSSVTAYGFWPDTSKTLDQQGKNHQYSMALFAIFLIKKTIEG